MSIRDIHSIMANFVIVLFGMAVFIEGHVLSSKGNLGERNYLVMAGFSLLALGTTCVLIVIGFGGAISGAAINSEFALPLLEKHTILALVALVIIGALTLVQGFFLWQQRELSDRVGWIFVGFAWLGFLVTLLTVYFGDNIAYRSY